MRGRDLYRNRFTWNLIQSAYNQAENFNGIKNSRDKIYNNFFIKLYKNSSEIPLHKNYKQRHKNT